MDRPRAEVMGLSLNSSTPVGAEMDVLLWIDNPQASAIDLVDIDFLVEEENEQQQFLVKRVQQAYAVQPYSSELVSVPLHLTYRDIVDDDEPFQAGQVIPCSLRANVNCRDAVSGILKLSAQRIKHLFTVGEPSSGSFQAPTGYVNGMDIVCVSPSKVDMQLVLRVKNSNALPVELLYTDFKMTNQAAQLSKRVRNGIVIRGQSSERLVIPLSITFQELSAAGFDVTPGQLLPFKLAMEFHFKQSIHGTYKIVQEKSGTIPVLQQPVVQLESVVLEREDGRPVARLRMLVDNSHNPRINYVLTEAEYVVSEASSGALVAKARWSYDGDIGTIKETDVVTILDMVVEGEHPEFGSSLWEVFTRSHNVYKPMLHLEAKSPDYGKLIFSP